MKMKAAVAFEAASLGLPQREVAAPAPDIIDKAESRVI